MEWHRMPQVKQVNHVAVVVDNMDKALTFWRDALGMELHELRDVPAEKSQVAFLPLPGSEVELVQPTTDDSGIAKYLAKRGPGMHHLCLEVDDIEAMLAQLRSKNVRLINEEPRLAADGKKYAFIHPESTGGVLVELYQI
jgi:methylmalonyl-CoA/ethylmalonyl-CoA epimerase